MNKFRVGFIFIRCFIQKALRIRDGVYVKPLIPTGSKGELRNIHHLFKQAGFKYNAKNMENSLEELKNTGHSTVLVFESVEAPNIIKAYDYVEKEADAIGGALAVISGNPTNLICAFVEGKGQAGYKLLLPVDTECYHPTNVYSLLDATSDIARRASSNDKYSLLVRLYRASLREIEIDNQILFQLVLLEEASDQSLGNTFAERLRNYCNENKFDTDLNILAKELDIKLPEGKDIIDALVKLRNCCAHNGKIDKQTLADYNGEWLYPLLDDKLRLCNIVRETIRYILRALAGHSRENKATLIKLKPGEDFELRFD